MDFIHRENPEVRFSWMSLPRYLQDVFWLSEVRFKWETLCNGTNSLPLKEASFRLVKRFITRTNNTTADYIKLTPFEEGRDFFSLETFRYLEAIQTCTLLLSSLFDEAERGDSFTTRATPEVLSETVWFNDFQPT